VAEPSQAGTTGEIFLEQRTGINVYAGFSATAALDIFGQLFELGGHHAVIVGTQGIRRYATAQAISPVGSCSWSSVWPCDHNSAGGPLEVQTRLGAALSITLEVSHIAVPALGKPALEQGVTAEWIRRGEAAGTKA